MTMSPGGLPRWLKWVGMAGLVLLALVAGYVLRGGPEPLEARARPAAPAGEEPAVEEWYCSMHPNIRSSEPGLCSICSMPLVPVPAEEEEEEGQGLRVFRTGPAALKLMQIEVSPVERRLVEREVRMVGKVAYDETRLRNITAWVGGRLDRLYVDYTGIRVEEGDHMVYIYSPELLAAQEELIQALRAVGELERSNIDVVRETTRATLESAREKLRLLGLTEQQVKETEERGTASDHLTIYAPIGGTVVHKHATEGVYVQTGAPIYTIADLSHLWLMLDAYESDLAWLRYGQQVEVRAEAYPGETFRGWIAFIDPVLDPKTRTVKVRVNVENPDRRLKPGMFVHAAVRAGVASGGRVMDPALAGKWICPMHPEVVGEEPDPCRICGMDLVTSESLGYVAVSPGAAPAPLVIPASAPLITGTRAVVYVQVPEADRPTFEGREIVLGPRAGDHYIVRHGLKEGDLVVSQGSFKIDSALQIRARPSMMTPEGGGGAAAHAHGEPAPAGAPAGGGHAAHAAAVPREFARQLGALREAFNALNAAALGEDLPTIRAAFGDLALALDAVDAELLPGDARAIWRELAMLLSNDAFEGGEAATLAAARDASGGARRRMERIEEHFPAAAPAPGRREAAAPEPFQRQLGGLWAAYQAFHAALAGDDEAGAVRAVDALAGALDEVDMALLSGDAHMRWMDQLAALQGALGKMRAAEDLAELRDAFPGLTEPLADAVKTFGMRPEAPVYRILCPMAFEGAGGVWLQGGTEVRNPFYGASMLACGEVIGTIEPAGAGPGGHAHE